MNRVPRDVLPDYLHRLLCTSRRILYWALPPLIFWIILRSVDLPRLGQLASGGHPALIILGLSLLVPVVMLGALRWHLLLHHYGCGRCTYRKSIREFWQGLAVGLLAPGTLGFDAYRILLTGERSGYYLRCAFIILIEKAGALFSCALLVAGLFPLLGPNRLPEGIARVVDALYLLLLAGGAGTAALLLLRRRRWAGAIAAAVNARLEAMTRRLNALAHGQPARGEEAREEGSQRTGAALIWSAFDAEVALPAAGLSLAIHLVSALQSQILFLAYGHQISFIVNLFIVPLLFLLYALPISFGGLGIREGAFILAYSAFGVPAETALVISLTGLAGNLISYGIGALLFYPGGGTRRL
ncbi:MAG TPA: lysylphosphatidylglycerol synthase transmembrane domain-containing protein [bacterium]|nr:lysylphosphatidylglycerol synthase transmembrane domain-containing protein [bacterium]